MGDNMINKKNKYKRKFKFNFGALLIIFVLSFSACFALYLTAANLNDDFFIDEFNADIEESSETSEEIQKEVEIAEPEENQPAPKNPVTNPVPQSSAVDYTYFENCCLITDSTLLEMNKYTLLTDIIGDSDLNASNCQTAKVESNYGAVTIYDTLKIKKPQNVYFMLGSDIGTSTTEDMIMNYTNLIENLTSVLPDMNIYIMQIPPVINDSENVTNELINSYNEQLLAMANSYGVYCIDTSTILKSVDGNLKEEYWSSENNKYSESLYKTISEYILTHVA